jgi:hypothetical protein
VVHTLPTVINVVHIATTVNQHQSAATEFDQLGPLPRVLCSASTYLRLLSSPPEQQIRPTLRARHPSLGLGSLSAWSEEPELGRGSMHRLVATQLPHGRHEQTSGTIVRVTVLLFRFHCLRNV